MHSTTQPTVLVLEDEIALLEAVVAKLKISGCEAFGARTVKDGLLLLKDHPHIQAVWLDHYLLGKEDGLDFTEKLRHTTQGKKLPVFVVTNTAGPDKVEAYEDLGIARYYTKSDHSLDQIIRDIKEYLVHHV